MDRAPTAGGRRADVPASAENLSQAAARRIALAAQGFGRPRGSGRRLTADDLVAAVGRLGLMQLDSVNVLCRSHYLPLFSRLGRYDRSELDRVTGHSDRSEETRDGAAGLRLVEYWAHQASLIPAGLHPLFRWRMARVDQELWAPVVKVAREQPDLVARALAMVQERGPIPASAIGTVRQAARPGQLWNWHAGKSALEYLFYAGKVAVSGRVNFERMYDAPERVLPASVMARPRHPRGRRPTGTGARRRERAGGCRRARPRGLLPAAPRGVQGPGRRARRRRGTGAGKRRRLEDARLPVAGRGAPRCPAGPRASLPVRLADLVPRHGPSGCSASATTSRSTRPPPSGSTVTTCFRSSSATSWSPA